MGLDYAGVPIFALPVVRDIADLIVTVPVLHYIATSKATAFINAVEFIPFFGDFFPKSNDKPAQYPSVVVAVEDIKEHMRNSVISALSINPLS